MAIDPKLLVIKPVSELETVNNPTTGSLLFYDGGDKLKKTSVADFYNTMQSAYLGIATTTTTPPATGAYWYRVDAPGTYMGVTVTAEDFKDAQGNYFDVTLEVKDGVVVKRKRAKENIIVETSVTNNIYNIDPAQIVPSEALYNNPTETLAGDIIKRVDINTGENVNYRETTKWIDGSDITDAKVDGVFYKKFNGKYYEKQVGDDVFAADFGCVPDADISTPLQLAINYCDAKRKKLILGAGYFTISKTIYLPNFINIQGQGRNKTIITNQWTNVENNIQFRNKAMDTSWGVTIQDMSFIGGVGVKWIVINSENQSNYILKNLGFAIYDTIIECSAPFQVNEMQNIHIESSLKGLVLNGFTSNYNTYTMVTFSCPNAIEINNQSEANLFYNCRIEGGSTNNGTYAIKLKNATNFTWVGGYIEGTNKKFLRDEGTRNGVTFNNTHFTGASNGLGGWGDLEFDSDGIVSFESPYFGESNGICEKAMVTGNIFGNLIFENLIIKNDGNNFSYVKKNKYNNSDEKEIDILKVLKVNLENDLSTNLNQVSGLIYVDILASRPGFSFSYLYVFSVKMTFAAVYPVALKVEKDNSLNENSDFDFNLSAISSGDFSKNTVLKGTLKNQTSLNDYDNVLVNIKCDFTQIATKQNLKLSL